MQTVSFISLQTTRHILVSQVKISVQELEDSMYLDEKST